MHNNVYKSTASNTMSTAEIAAGQLRIRYLIDGSQNGSMGMFELTVPPASNVPPPHSHSNNEELVYVLEGTLRYPWVLRHETLSQGKVCIRQRAPFTPFRTLSMASPVR